MTHDAGQLLKSHLWCTLRELFEPEEYDRIRKKVRRVLTAKPDRAPQLRRELIMLIEKARSI